MSTRNDSVALVYTGQLCGELALHLTLQIGSLT